MATKIVEAVLNSDLKNPYCVYTFYGTSLETKPTTPDVGAGSVWLETDTSDIYIYNEEATQWREW